MKLAMTCLLCGMMMMCGLSAASGEAACPAYDVILPEGYETSNCLYPVVYVLSEDGLSGGDGGIGEKLSAVMKNGDCAQMIIVKPVFEAGMDLHAVLQALIKEIDRTYRTLSQSRYRALMGTGTGGYLAYSLGLTHNDSGKIKANGQEGLFSALVSIRGNFSGEDNPWRAAYGDVYDMMEGMHLKNPGVFNSMYTYMDAPVNDPYTNMQHSTNDLGALMIGFSTGSAYHEYTARPGVFDDAFLTESILRAADRLSGWMFPKEEEKKEEPEALPEADETPVVDGGFMKLELMGDWHFQYTGANKLLDVPALNEAEFTAWPQVRPMCNWAKGYGNISDQNVKSSYGPDYFDYFIVGSGYYAKAFDLPADFDGGDMLLSIGYVDDRCEVFVNGIRVGATGMDENGNPTGETTWAAYSLFELEGGVIRPGERNTIVVRAWNDLPFGAGGWYGGPIGLYSREAFDTLYPSNANERFYEETFVSAYAASAKGEKEPAENPYLIYLPEDYHTSGRRYPTVYMLHQFNSDHTSYQIDKIDQLLDEGVRSGAFDGMIVVIPNSSAESWWKGDWEKMVTEELVPLIDSKYRTIRDARYRLTAGCSMGGQGAMSVALRNPDLFSGAVSFFGAFSYGGESSPNAIAAAQSAAYMDAFSLYFICGNQDSYGFGVPAIALNQQLERMGVRHGFLIDNGGHDGSFYLPRFIDAFAWVRKDMHKSDAAVENLLRGSASMQDGHAHIRFEAMDGMEAYLYEIPESSYTKNAHPELSIPLVLEVQRGGKVMQRIEIAENAVSAGSFAAEYDVDLGDAANEDAQLVLKAMIFDRVVTLAQ